jgi:hypothetical protein
VRAHLEVRVHLLVRPSLALARCGRLWLATAGCGLAAAGSDQLRPSLAVVRPDLAVVRPDLARCGRPCTIALMHPSKVHVFIVIPIFVYLQVKVPTNLVEPHWYLKCA